MEVGSTAITVSTKIYLTNGLLSSETDGNRTISKNYYDDYLNVKTKRKSYTEDGVTKTLDTRLEYDSNRNVLTSTDWTGSKIINKYDALDRVYEKGDSTGIKEYLQFNWSGKQTISLDANFDKSEFIYDSNGNVSKKIDKMNKSIIYSYDYLGNVIEKKEMEAKQ